MASKGAVTCAVCPESAWLVTFLIGNVSTGVVTWSALRCGASGESGKKVAAAPLSKTAAAAAAAKTWFAKLPLDYMLHNRFPWKRSGRRSSMWPPYSLRRNLSAAACRPCDRSLTRKMFPLDDVISCDRCILTVTLPTLKRTHIGFQLSTLAKTCPNCEGTQHIIGSVRDCGSYDANAFFCWAIDIYIYILYIYIFR